MRGVVGELYQDRLKEARAEVARLRAELAAERERCAKIADDRAMADRNLYQNETDWRMPYAFNRVVRASMDIAAAIRNATG